MCCGVTLDKPDSLGYKHRRHHPVCESALVTSLTLPKNDPTLLTDAVETAAYDFKCIKSASKLAYSLAAAVFAVSMM